MNERKGIVTFGGKPVTLVGPELKVGERAPDFTLTGNELQPVRLEDFRNRILIILTLPSLDTPVCDLETRRFNSEAEKLGAEVAVLAVSMDLPFAQKRWCGAAGVKNVLTASDHRDGTFGTAYGVLIKEFRLLARTVFVVDRGGIIRYIQLVPEAGKEPDYGSVLAAVQNLKKE
ncbi:MAG: thiol peroxidase [candidate division WOR-3 bacterium]|jgi:thiol peroxidase